MSTKKLVENLPGWVKALLGALGAVDVLLRVLAVIDIAQRSDDEVNGPKKVWLPALAALSSMGLLPAAYFLIGRKDQES